MLLPRLIGKCGGGLGNIYVRPEFGPWFTGPVQSQVEAHAGADGASSGAEALKGQISKELLAGKTIVDVFSDFILDICPIRRELGTVIEWSLNRLAVP